MTPVEIVNYEDEGRMALVMAGFTVAEAFLTSEAGWIVLSTRELFQRDCSRDQAISALTVIEFRVYGMPETHAAIRAMLAELPK